MSRFVRPGGGEALHEGAFPCRIMSAEIVTPRIGPYANIDMMAIRYEILAGPSTGRMFGHDTPMYGKLHWLTNRTVRAVMPTYGGGEFNLDDLVGRIVVVTITPRITKNGQPSLYPRVDNVQFYVPSGLELKEK